MTPFWGARGSWGHPKRVYYNYGRFFREAIEEIAFVAEVMADVVAAALVVAVSQIPIYFYIYDFILCILLF